MAARARLRPPRGNLVRQGYLRKLCGHHQRWASPCSTSRLSVSTNVLQSSRILSLLSCERSAAFSDTRALEEGEEARHGRVPSVPPRTFYGSRGTVDREAAGGKIFAAIKPAYTARNEPRRAKSAARAQHIGAKVLRLSANRAAQPSTAASTRPDDTIERLDDALRRTCPREELPRTLASGATHLLSEISVSQ